MRYLLPMLLACVLLLATTLAPAAGLAPYQQAALDRILATMDAETRAYARPQLEQMLGTLSEAEVELVLQSMVDSSPDNPPEDTIEDAAAGGEPASPADLEFNRAQYEPALREAWQASKSFDTFAEQTLAAHCPGGDDYAVFGAGWRYELAPMQPTWTRASDSPDLDVQILGASYAPQDGRYRFDFSASRNTFDRPAVERAIAAACTAYREIGDAFMTAIRADSPDDPRDDLPPNGYELEQAANGQAFALMRALGEELQALGPAGNAPILNALISGTPVD